jgi:hypothetical protein
LAANQPGTRKKRKFRFKNPLMSLDATVIDLCAKMFDWAKFRRPKGAVKLHLLLDHDGLCFARIKSAFEMNTIQRGDATL